MTTRASLARGVVKEHFEGRVHKWERRWVHTKKGTKKEETMLELLKWVLTDERCPDLLGARHPHIKPVKATKTKPKVEPQPPAPAAEAPAAEAPNPAPPPDIGGQPPGSNEALPPAAQAPAAPAAAAAAEVAAGDGGGTNAGGTTNSAEVKSDKEDPMDITCTT